MSGNLSYAPRISMQGLRIYNNEGVCIQEVISLLMQEWYIVSLFNGISIFEGYLMPKKNNSHTI